jgi:Tol biopolymer transport system component
MKATWRAILLTTCLIVIAVVIGLGQEAQATPLATNASYLPLISNGLAVPINQIAFLGADVNIFGNQLLYRINGDGSGLKTLTANSSREISFSWSPDGSRIAISAKFAGNYEVYLMHSDGSGMVNLTNNPADDLEPSWSPDGHQLAFISKRDGSAQVFVMGSNGGGVTRLTNLSSSCGQPIWSPDGTKIVFNSFDPFYNDAEIYVINPDGTGLLWLTNNAMYDSVLGWSPDSSKILFLSNRDQGGADNKQDLYSMNADGTNVVRLTSTAYIQDAAWSPDGSKIAYTDFMLLYVMNSDGSNSNRVRCMSEEIAAIKPTWSQDGTKLAYSLQTGNAADYGIFTVNIDSSDCQHLITMQANTPKWRPFKQVDINK